MLLVIGYIEQLKLGPLAQYTKRSPRKCRKSAYARKRKNERGSQSVPFPRTTATSMPQIQNDKKFRGTFLTLKPMRKKPFVQHRNIVSLDPIHNISQVPIRKRRALEPGPIKTVHRAKKGSASQLLTLPNRLK